MACANLIIPVVYIIFESHHQIDRPIASKLWSLIDRTWAVHPKLATDVDRRETAAIGRLILHAWRQHQDHLKEARQVEHLPTPKCVMSLQSTLNPQAVPAVPTQQPVQTFEIPVSSATTRAAADPFDSWDLGEYNFDNLDWSENWLSSLDVPATWPS